MAQMATLLYLMRDNINMSNIVSHKVLSKTPIPAVNMVHCDYIVTTTVMMNVIY